MLWAAGPGGSGLRNLSLPPLPMTTEHIEQPQEQTGHRRFLTAGGDRGKRAVT